MAASDMKPGNFYFGHRTFDLTEGKIHRLQRDGKTVVVVLFPRKWKALETVKMTDVNKVEHDLTPYMITEWDEVELPSEEGR